MPRRSTVAALPAEILERVNAMIRDGATVPEILARLEEPGESVSRSALYRYKSRMERQLQRYREAQEVAGVWVRQLADDADDKVGRLLAEMIKTVAFNTISQLGEDGAESTTPEDLAHLARSIKDLVAARKGSAEIELRIRKDVVREAAREVEQVARRQGLSAAAVAELKASFLGLAKPS